MDKVYDYLLNESGIRNRDTIVLGISGGPDSMALLDLMLKLRKELNLVLVVAHINHNVRKESKDEEEYLKRFCKDKSVHFESMKIESIGDDNFENEARTIRYNFFHKICTDYSSKYLMTAHHGDDLIETILMRIVRGSTLKGYSGFSKVVERDDYTIIRPLIIVTKEELVNYCNRNGIKYFIDKTNEMDIHTRNRYRKYVLPFLKSENENVHEKFLHFSETLLEYSNYIDKEAVSIFNRIFNSGKLEIDKFKEIDHLMQTKIVYNILEKLYGDDLFIITNTHVNLINDLIYSEKAQALVHLPNNVKAIKTYNTIEFGFDDEVNDEYEIEINDIVNLPNGKIIEVLKEEEDDNSNFIIRLSKKEVTLPLYVRTRRNGDKMVVKSMKGHKKVNDIFIENKISTKERNSWPIVCDAKDEIIWLPGLKKSKYDVENSIECDIILKYY